jgi:hypothetical protein
VDPALVAVVAATALVAVGFVAWQAAIGAGVVAAYRERAADASPPLAVFVVPAAGAGGAGVPAAAGAVRLLVRNRGDLAALRVAAWERWGLVHEPAPLATVDRIEPGGAAEVELADRPTAPACHLEWTPDRPGAARRQADVPILELGRPGA